LLLWRFSFSLKKKVIGGAMQAKEKTLTGKHVLVVEDEYFLAEELCTILADAGAAVLGPVPNAVAALELLARGPRPDVAVLDVELRGENVYRVSEILQARSVPFIFSTGYGQEAIDDRSQHIGRVEKPYSKDALFAVIAAAL
jgi:CheY-like chemotaxis protein